MPKVRIKFTMDTNGLVAWPDIPLSYDEGWNHRKNKVEFEFCDPECKRRPDETLYDLLSTLLPDRDLPERGTELTFEVELVDTKLHTAGEIA